MTARWYEIANEQDVASPALLLYPDRVEENIRRMIRVAGSVDRVRPHMKTNKLPEVVRMVMRQGVTKFKCATIAEAEMIAACGARDVLLAYQPVGPNARRFADLVRRFPATRFSALVDDEGALRELSKQATESGVTVDLLLDIDCGMHRTGIAPDDRAARLYRLMANLPGIQPAGLHAYDGHIRDADPAARERSCDAAFAPVRALRKQLEDAGVPVPVLVAGGTPTFPVHATRADVECSPGTLVFWDWGYGASFPDMDFLPAVTLLTRVISKPDANLLCLDLGHKAVASEMPHPRVQLFGLEDARFTGHSEEHLTLETSRAGEIAVGCAFYGIPWHICPTVALHSQAVVVRDGRAVERWDIVARARTITI